MSFVATIEDPRVPTIRRWRNLNRRFCGNSTLRMLEYEKLSELELTGVVLDLGGGDNARYKVYLPDTIEKYVSVNIDPDIAPTHLIEPGEKLPIDDNSIDNCISLNTLEHVYDAKFLIAEIHRVLKPGGKFFITVPWIFTVHGHPDDYSRHTPSWWNQTLKDTGYASANIMPLIWGRQSTAVSITGFRGIFVGLRKHIAHLKDIIYAKLMFSKTGGVYSGKRGQRICNVAPGHFITAVK